MKSHRAVARYELGDEAVDSALAGEPHEGIRPAVGFALRLSDHLGGAPRAVGEEAVRALRAEGVAEEDLDRVVEICAAFHVINRVADCLEFAIPSERALRRSAPIMYRRGYSL